MINNSFNLQSQFLEKQTVFSSNSKFFRLARIYETACATVNIFQEYASDQWRILVADLS